MKVYSSNPAAHYNCDVTNIRLLSATVYYKIVNKTRMHNLILAKHIWIDKLAQLAQSANISILVKGVI
jgi:hypothetical protein